MKLDLTNTGIRPLVIKDEDSGATVRYTFSTILNRQQRSLMMKKVGKGNQAREVPDLERLFKRCILTMELNGVETEGLPEGAVVGNVINKPDVIAQILLLTENQGGLPEEHVEQVVRYLMGENTLGEERGNT